MPQYVAEAKAKFQGKDVEWLKALLVALQKKFEKCSNVEDDDILGTWLLYYQTVRTVKPKKTVITVHCYYRQQNSCATLSRHLCNAWSRATEALIPA